MIYLLSTWAQLAEGKVLSAAEMAGIAHELAWLERSA
jgi:hypothetical protein